MKPTYHAIRAVFVLGIFVFAATAAIAQTSCTANFSKAQIHPNEVQFTGTPTGTGANKYSWSMGDGGSGYGASYTYRYNAPGLYTVCLTVTDSTGTTNCNSQFCDTVHVSGTITCTLRAYADSLRYASCDTCKNGSAYIHVSGGNTPYTYSWNTGLISSTLTHAAPGTYYATVTDVNGCMTKDTVVILYNSGCQARFSKKQTAPNVILFTNTSYDTLSGHPTCYWNLGDGTNVKGDTISHTYQDPGIYNVYMTMQDSLGLASCSSSHTDTVRVTGSKLCMLSLTFYPINASCSSCHDGADSVIIGGNYTYPYRYAWSNGDTTFLATGLAPGTCSLCVTDARGCKICQPDVISYAGTHSCSATFALRADTTTPGNYVVVNSSTGSGTMHYDWSWGDGTPDDTTATPTHTYAAAAHVFICLTVKDAAGCTSSYCDSTHVSRLAAGAHTTIHVVLPVITGISNRPELSGWNLYPNPSGAEVTLNYELSQSSALEISLSNLLGEHIVQLQNTALQAAGSYSLKYNTANLKPGIYLLRLKTNNSMRTTRLTVIR
jgi:PKD repeat protein